MHQKKVLESSKLPKTLNTEEELDDFISWPTEGLSNDFSRLEGDIIILGVAGKVGPGLARMAKLAAPDKRIIGVARFTNQEVRKKLEKCKIETIECDLLNSEAVNDLPKVTNVIYMAGRKFGTSGDEPFSWAMNTHAPGIVAQAFRNSRIVAFSTLCVYPFSTIQDLGCDENTAPTPFGEYANSCVGRERIFQYFSRKYNTPGRLIRLNYAIDLRYGVLFDVANWVRNQQPIDLSSGHTNVIWHGDVNNQVLRSLLFCETPCSPLNLGGLNPISIRDIANIFGEKFRREPQFLNMEKDTGWVNRTDLSQKLLGSPVVRLENMVEWVADWIERDLPNYGKPTRYEVRDGVF